MKTSLPECIDGSEHVQVRVCVCVQRAGRTTKIFP